MVSEPQIGPQASGHESSRELGGPGEREEAPPRTQCYKNGLVVGGLVANGLGEDPVMKGLVEIPAGWLRGLCPSLDDPKSPKEVPFSCWASELCGGNSGAGKGLAKAPAGGTVCGKPGPTLLIPKPGPGARPLGWNGLVEGSRGWAAGAANGLVRPPKASPGLLPPPAVGTWPVIPKMLPGTPPADVPGPRRLPTSVRLFG